MLGDHLRESGCKVLHATGDADVLIAQTVVNCAAVGATNLVGEDTDLLVLLCYHARWDSFPLFLQSDKKQTTKKMRKWDIHWIQRAFGHEIYTLLPFVHAIGGSDTTSRMFGIEKGVTFTSSSRLRSS